MKVFRIRPDPGRYQMVGSAPRFTEEHVPTHAGAPALQNWRRLQMAVHDPLKKRGEFLFFPLEFLVASPVTTETFMDCIRTDVQILPVGVDASDEDYCLWNIVNFTDAIDPERTAFGPPPFQSIPSVWAFKADRLSRAMLFRDQRCPAILLVTTGVGDPDTDFYRRYHDLGMKGLTFDLLWRSDGPSGAG